MANQAIVQRLDGSTYEVAIGARFRMAPGERVIGKRVVASSLWNEMKSESGLGVGDAVAWVTKQFGVQPCAPCNKRRQKWNKVRVRLPIIVR